MFRKRPAQVGKDSFHRKTIGKPWENGGLMGFNAVYPLVMTKIAIENGNLQ